MQGTDPSPHGPAGIARLAIPAAVLLAAAALALPSPAATPAAAAQGAGGPDTVPDTRADAVPEAAADTVPGRGEGEAARGRQTIRVFLDCSGRICDFDYLRRQIPYVDWVRRRQGADVHVLVTDQDTGAGGERITVDLIGRGRFEGMDQSLEYTVPPSQAQARTREGLARRVQLGLLGYVADTGAADRVRIEYEGEAEGEEAPSREEDPWNLWVFRTGLGGSMGGEASRRRYSVNGSLAASRTTRGLKIDLGTRGSFSESHFELNDTTFVTQRHRLGLEAVVVSSVGPHWSVGGQGLVRSTSFRNQDVTLGFGPALEFNVFPYEESNRRQLTVLYAVSGTRYDYDQETVFLKLSETRFDHSLNVSLDLEQPWGEAGLSLEGSHFLNDLDRNRLSVFGNVELQLVEGLSLDLFGGGSRVQDQIYLPLEEASDEEVLVGERALATDFNYFFRAGFSYTFGSIYSNVVNTRFDELDGGD